MQIEHHSYSKKVKELRETYEKCMTTSLKMGLKGRMGGITPTLSPLVNPTGYIQ